MAKPLMEIINSCTDEEGCTNWEDVKNNVCPDLPTSELYQHYDNLDIRIVIDWSEWYKSFFFDIYFKGKQHAYRGIPNTFYTRSEAENKAFVLAELFARGQIDELYQPQIKWDELSLAEQAHMRALNSEHGRLGQLDSKLSTLLNDAYSIIESFGDKNPYRWGAMGYIENMCAVTLRNIKNKKSIKG